MREVLPSIGNGRIRIPAPGKYQKELVQVRRSLADLPAPSKQMNFISVVCLYTLVGLSDYDISIALNCNVENVENVKTLDAYSTVYEYVVKSILDTEADDIRSLFVQNAKQAARNVVDLANNSEEDAVKLRANADVLDRAGFRPADVVEIRQKLDSTLRIEFVKEDKREYPVIDAEDIQDS